MAGFTDWTNLGVFPLQDHAAEDDKVELSARMMLVGGRIVKMRDPTVASTSDECTIEYGRENGLGTLGDVHPWSFWQTADRAKRGCGSWSMAWGSIVALSEPRYNQLDFLPIADRTLSGDARYAPRTPNWPAGMPRFTRGQMAIILPSMKEFRQEDVAFMADPRLLAPHVGGDGASGTLVCDLQPTGQICMDEATEPGVSGRHARLQSLVRVIALSDNVGTNLISGRHNILALNYSYTGQEQMAGLGAIWSRGSTKTRTGGPVTGAGSASFSGSFLAGRDTPGNEESVNPNNVGEFSPSRLDDHAVAVMSSTVYGPIHGGSINDKHRFADDRDGHPIQSAHIDTGAFFYRNEEEDAPLYFEGEYPLAADLPFIAKVHLGYDNDETHLGPNGPQQGMWKWWCDSPDGAGGGGPKTPSVPVPPAPPSGPGSPRFPNDPKQPSTPNTPSTPGTPTTPSQPGQPKGPTTPGPYDPTGRLEKQYRDRLRKLGYTGQFPTPSNRVRPDRPLPPKPAGPSRPTTPSKGAQPQDPTNPDPTPGDGENVRVDGGETYFFERAKPKAPGQIDTVGGAAPDLVGAWNMARLAHSGFSAMSFRPQLWVSGYPNYEHNPRIDQGLLRQELETRPQVVAVRAWGQQNDSGFWEYQESPYRSRAHGGRAYGGVLWSPPQYEMEDYFQINSQRDVKANTGIEAYITAAPGVAWAFGTPNTSGTVEPASVVMAQKPLSGDADESWYLAQVDSDGTLTDLLRARVDQDSTEQTFDVMGSNAMLIPRGTTAQRPAALGPTTGHFRILADESGDRIEHYDGTAWVTYARTDDWDQNGFPRDHGTTITWSDSTPDRTIEIDNAGGSYTYFVGGTKYYKDDAETLQIANTEGNHYIYFDGSSLAETVNPTAAQVINVIQSYALVAIVYWDATNSLGYMFDERHGKSMAPDTHVYLHYGFGVRYGSGLGLNNFTIDDSGNDDVDAQFSCASGLIVDEDLETTVSSFAVGDTVDVWYLDGSNWRVGGATNFAVKSFVGGSGRLAYNDSGSQTEVANNDFVLCHIFGTNLKTNAGGNHECIAIQGQDTYQTIISAREGAETEINTLFLGGLPTPELKPIGTVIFQTSTGYSNTVKARTRTTDTGDNYVDWRESELSPSAPLGNYYTRDESDALFVNVSGDTMTGDLVFNDNINATFGTGSDATIDYDGTNLNIIPDAVGSGVVKFGSHIDLDDNDSIRFGTSQDATIKYDGTNLEINPDVVGSGAVDIDGSLTVTGDITATGTIDGVTFKLNGATLFTGSWVNAEGDTVNVSSGLITSVVSP